MVWRTLRQIYFDQLHSNICRHEEQMQDIKKKLMLKLVPVLGLNDISFRFRAVKAITA